MEAQVLAHCLALPDTAEFHSRATKKLHKDRDPAKQNYPQRQPGQWTEWVEKRQTTQNDWGEVEITTDLKKRIFGATGILPQNPHLINLKLRARCLAAYAALPTWLTSPFSFHVIVWQKNVWQLKRYVLSDQQSNNKRDIRALFTGPSQILL